MGEQGEQEWLHIWQNLRYSGKNFSKFILYAKVTTIIGSIDNAWKHEHSTDIHHLIFTEKSVLIFGVLSKEYIKTEASHYLSTDPINSIPNVLTHRYALHRDSKNIDNEIVEQAIFRGTQIEKNLDSEIAKIPPAFREIDYTDITKIILSQGKFGESPSLSILTKKSKLKFRLMHNNYEGSSRIDEETFAKYADTLKKAIGDQAKIQS